MKKMLDAYGRFVGQRPLVALASVAAITAIAIYGMTITAPEADASDAFLPSGSELIAAQGDLAESFPASSGLQSIQVVLRGDVLSPEGAHDGFTATEVVVNDPGLQSFLAASRPPTSPGHLLQRMVAGPNGDPSQVELSALTQDDIDAAISDSANQADVMALEDLVARDANGLVIGGIGVVTVNENNDLAALETAQLAVDAVVQDLELSGLESARTLSAGREAADDGASTLLILMLVALVLICVLLTLFYRRLSDVLLGFAGLVVTIIWALGFQGLLGPEGLDLIGAPSVMGQMVPVMMIGLCVDYGIQSTARYREAIASGRGAETGVSEAVAAVGLPLGLAGGTTIISFLTNIFGDISGISDFGVVAGVGVASGLYVFLTGVMAARVLIDGRRERAGKPLPSQPMNEAIPGAGRLIESVSAVSVRKPGWVLLGFGVMTMVFGVLATQLDSTFSSRDFLADGTETKDDTIFLEDSLGGNTEPVTVLIEAEIALDRTLRNLLDFSDGLEDPVQRPAAVTSGVTGSLGVVLDGVLPEVADELEELSSAEDNSPLVLSTSTVQASLDVVRAADPMGFDSVVSYGNGDVPDRTIVQFDALTGDSELTRELFNDVDGLWLGDSEEITPIAAEIISLEVSDSLTESQTTSIVITVIAALIVLMLFFWATEFRPMLAVLSVLPILLVLVWVLGTMVILGYSYNVITALITALSVGIGVDYTIHITHRFLEEREAGASSIADAVSLTMNTTGGALIGSAFTTALGFAVLIFSPIPPIGEFGLLTAVAVFYSLIAAVVVLPPLLVIWAAYHDWRSGQRDIEQLPSHS